MATEMDEYEGCLDGLDGWDGLAGSTDPCRYDCMDRGH